MIIKAPTGAYNTVLPKNPEDPTSIIYTISNMDPPRSNLQFTIIPNGVKYELRAPRQLTQVTRRKVMGDLVLTTKDASPTKALDGTKLFSFGQVLDFEAQVTNTILPRMVGDTISTRHNANYVDNSKLGIDNDEKLNIDATALNAQKIILNDIDALHKSRTTLEADIAEYQRTINEINRVIIGLDAILALGDDAEIMKTRTKLDARRKSDQNKLNRAVSQLNKIPAQIQIKRDALLALAELVK